MLVAPLVVVLVALLVVPAAADRRARPRIPTYDVVLTLRADGVLHVRETITFDFADDGRGIVRRLRYRDGDRVYEVRDVRASSSTGAPARVRTTKLGHHLRIGVGTGGPEVRGRQAYVIEYDVLRAFTPRAGFDELEWDAIGTGWDVPIEHAAVRVEGPVRLRDVTCLAGTTGTPGASVACARDRDGRYAIDFTQNGLAAGEGMRVRVRLPRPGGRGRRRPRTRVRIGRGRGRGLDARARGRGRGAGGAPTAARPPPPPPPGAAAGTGLVAAGAMLIVAQRGRRRPRPRAVGVLAGRPLSGGARAAVRRGWNRFRSPGRRAVAHTGGHELGLQLVGPEAN
ncbi:hypothetical protein BJF79_10410 [Actinomadura sp. CNU-125]|nr:hypothetical protein BJF79_10410 [Actinomadura sp. CNU-125]